MQAPFSRFGVPIEKGVMVRPTRLTIKPLYKWLMAKSQLSPKAIGNGLCPSADG